METTGSVNLSDAQRSQFNTVFSDSDEGPVDADFGATFCAAIPEDITIQPWPSKAASVSTDGNEYQYFVAQDGHIVIVAPDTREVVRVVDEAA